MRVTILSLLLLVTGCQKSEPSTTGQGVLTPFFYQLIAPNGKTSHILGTIHSGVAADELGPAVSNAFNRSSVYIVETKFDRSLMEDIISNRIEQKMVSQFKPRGEELPESYRQILTSEWNIPSAIASRAGDKNCELVFSGVRRRPPFMDFSLIKRAYDAGKAMIQLDDTVETKKHASDELPEPKMNCSVRRIMDDNSAVEQWRELNQMYANYRAGDESKFGEPSNGVITRNRAWMRVLEVELTKGNIFVAVGVGHLFSKNGVLDLLASKGYKISRLSR